MNVDRMREIMADDAARGVHRVSACLVALTLDNPLSESFYTAAVTHPRNTWPAMRTRDEPYWGHVVTQTPISGD